MMQVGNLRAYPVWHHGDIARIRSFPGDEFHKQKCVYKKSQNNGFDSECSSLIQIVDDCNFWKVNK